MELSNDMNVYGRCDCRTSDQLPAVSYAACAGCGHDVRYLRDESVHWEGEHWHMACALDAATSRLRVDRASGPVDASKIAKAGEFKYRGSVYVRPIERGVVLKDIEFQYANDFKVYLDNAAALVATGSSLGDGEAELEIIIRRVRAEGHG